MGTVTFNRPAFPHTPPNTGDGAESGDSWDQVLAKLNLIFASNNGNAIVDFGAFPGGTDTSITITGLTSIVATSVVDAWVIAKDSADHSADEHWVDPPVVTAGNIVPNVGFTIYAITRDNKFDYGKWNVGWQFV